MLNLLGNIEAIDDSTKLNMLIQWLSTYLNQQDIVEIIDERLKELEDEDTDVDDLDSENTDENVKVGGGAPSRPSMNMDINVEEPETEINNEEEPNETETPEIAPQVDLASIEGEDLI